jgi:hypothetical protein
MPDIFGGHLDYEYRVMEMLRVGMRTMDPPLGYYSSAQTELIRRFEDMSWELRTYMLADHIDDVEVVDVRHEKHECLRFATWWDHWKATYRGRWWMRWRRWTVNYNIEARTLTARAEADLSRYWAYPQANVTPPEFGAPVRWSVTHMRPQKYEPEPVEWYKRRDGGNGGER